MEVVNLLKFINSVSDLYTLDFARCDGNLINLLDLMNEDEQFTRNIDLGIIYINQLSLEQYTIVDGLNRILSLYLLLHAICECYKKTTPQNEKAIKTIRSKYIFSHGSKFKLHLPDDYSALFAKIINGERLSGQEKNSSMFCLLHNLWTQIKQEKLQAGHIFKMLQKINVTIVETDNVSKRDLYYKINSEKRELNQISLINNYLKENGILEFWNDIKESYFFEPNDIILFLKDFLVTKFNYKTYNPDNLYKNFLNYFETMMLYVSEDTLMNTIKKSAKLYYNILNINFKNENIRHLMINIKRHNGSDTYPYILNVYDDYYSDNISESIFIEILNTIDEYLVNRQKSGQNIDFNELVQYLSTLITYN